MDEPTDLPEGVVLDLVVDDEGDELEPDELKVLEGKIKQSLQDIEAGRHRPGTDFLRELRGKQ
jgi:hypothetical protein